MSGRPHYTQKQVIDAVIKAGGLKAPAARALQCSRHTITRYIERYPAIKEAYDDAIQSSIDLAQSKLMILIEREDWRAIRYMLSTLGKDRGFTERQEFAAVGEDAEARHQQFLQDILKVYGDGEEEDDDE